MQATLDMRKSSLLALTKSNQNLGMKILQLEREMSSDKILKWEGEFVGKSWKNDDHFGSI